MTCGKIFCNEPAVVHSENLPNGRLCHRHAEELHIELTNFFYGEGFTEFANSSELHDAYEKWLEKFKKVGR